MAASREAGLRATAEVANITSLMEMHVGFSKSAAVVLSASLA